jgi:hypothetical protein
MSAHRGPSDGKPVSVWTNKEAFDVLCSSFTEIRYKVR